MIYYNNGTKRDLPIWNLRAYHVRNHDFGTQTIEISEITCQNEKPITFFKPKKKSTYNHQNRVLNALEVI